MPILTPYSTCNLCQQLIGDDDSNIIALPLSVASFDPLFMLLYDSCVHRSCLNRWDRKQEFVELYNQSVFASSIKGIHPLRILDDGSVEMDRFYKSNR